MKEESYRKIAKTIGSYKHGEDILRTINNLTTSLVYITYPIFMIILWIKKDPRFLKALLVPAISFLIVSVFRNLYNAPRPYEIYRIKPIINKDSKGKSFPSRHVFSVFVIATSIYFISVPLGIILGLVGLVIALVRVLGGVHFPRDVIAASLVGILSGIIGWTINIF